jgi:hypothetical protein
MASLIVAGDTSGSITISAPLVAGSGTLTLPVATDTLIGKATTDTLTNKTLTSPTLTSPALGTPASGVLTNCTGVAAAALPAGSVIQVVNYQTGAVATGTTLIPNDDTIPQITEGNEYMTLAITPTSATSLLEVTVTAISGSSAGNYMCVALFRDSGANALATAFFYTAIDTYYPVTYSYRVVSGSVSATTFRVRIGGNNAGTTTFNGRNGVRLFGGTMASSITIKEYVA